jgi:hypothetical protein
MTTPTTPLKPEQTSRHIWILIKLGRVCRVCYLVQESGKFNDEVACPGAQAARFG